MIQRYCILRLMVMIFILITIVQHVISGGYKSVGIPFIKNFTKQDYNSGTQNWAIVQDKKGILYFGNNNGILEFDGSEWNIFVMPNKSVVRSLLRARDNKIYAGAYNEFGYLGPSEKGTLKYHSLVHKLPANHRNFGEIWKIHEIRDTIYFQSFSYLFRYNKGKVDVLFDDRNFHFSFKVHNSLYIQDLDRGLMKFSNEVLKEIPDGKFFNNKRIWMALSYGDNKILIGTANHGLYLYDRPMINAWNIGISEYLKSNQIYCGINLGNNEYAIGTIQDGLLVMNDKGKVILHVRKAFGIQNNTVLSLFHDKDKNLWLGLDNGIDYLKINSAVSYIKSVKEMGAGYAAAFKDRMVYLGTNQGLFYAPWNHIKSPHRTDAVFNIIKNTKGQVWNLYGDQKNLLCAHNNGLYSIKNRKAIPLLSEVGCWTFVNYPNKQNLLLAGTYYGLVILHKNTETGSWEFQNRVKGFKESCREVVPDKKYIWVSHGYKGMYKIKLNENLTIASSIKLYDANDGLQTNLNINVFKIHESTLFSSDSGTFIYNREKDRFELSEKFNNLFNGKKINRVVQDNNSNYWYFQDQMVGILYRNLNGNYYTELLPFNELKGSFIETFENLLFIDDNNVIISTDEGFVHFDPSLIDEPKDTFRVQIRKFETIGGEIIAGGRNPVLHEKISEPDIHIPYKKNSVGFHFSALDFESTGFVSYQYFLHGFDNNWSGWSDVHNKEYTNLPEGEYIFIVRARNINNAESTSIPLQFIIDPPWFRSKLAYISYLLFIAGLITLTVYYFIRRFEEEKRIIKEKQKKVLEEKEKRFAEEAYTAEREIIKLRNDKLNIEIEKNKAELQHKQKELTSIAFQITYKNEVIQKVKQSLQSVLQKMVHEDSKKQVQELIKIIEKDHLNKEDWKRFEMNFDQVHEDFIKHLKSEYPELTPKDLKLCAYLRMNLSTKEIAPLLNISVRGVEISRYRLRKKMGLSRDVNLTEFFMDFI